jgi:NAD(P)-dependent dehydrogenase (short-subunit alcohol dehydrogenase family)
MDVAAGVVFLVSPAASLVTGVTLLIDGGWTAR